MTDAAKLALDFQELAAGGKLTPEAANQLLLDHKVKYLPSGGLGFPDGSSAVWKAREGCFEVTEPCAKTTLDDTAPLDKTTEE